MSLSGIASDLAEKLVPGFTERTRRPRMLTVLALGARILSRYSEGTYGDHPEGSASIAFERLVLEAYAWQGKRSSPGYLRIPGIGKARDAADAGVRLKRLIYLKSPEAVGLWVAYKGLSVELGLLDADGHVLEPGIELLAAWERGIGERGLLSSHSEAAEGLLRQFEAALAPLLGIPTSNGWKPRSVWKLIARHVSPHELTRPEARVIRRVVCEQDKRRTEIFALVSRAAGKLPSPLKRTSQELVEALPRASSELARVVKTIQAYEALVSLLTEAWSLIRFVGARNGDGRVSTAQVVKDEESGGRFAAIPTEVSAALEEVRPGLEDLGLAAEASETLGWLDGPTSRSPNGLFAGMLERHRSVQHDKPPDGKRPWIEGESGHYFVRTRYFLDEPWETGAWVHPYRLHSVVSFLQELGDMK